MKKTSIVLAAFSLLLIFANSCKKDESTPITSGIVTVKTADDGSCHFQLDDKTALIPTNETLKTNPYKKEVRALTNYYDKGVVNYKGKDGVEYRGAEIITLDSILTKLPVPSVKDNDSIYGSDPIAIYNSWITVVEDGYLTIYFCAPWGRTGVTHSINLVKGTTKDSLCFELRHNANGETIFSDYTVDGMAAFNIKDILSSQKAPYNISVKYYNGATTRTVTFKYTPGTSAHIEDISESTENNQADQ